MYSQSYGLHKIWKRMILRQDLKEVRIKHDKYIHDA